PENIGRVSGFGWGLGYFGGLASLLAVAPLLKGGFTISNLSHLQAAWLVTAAFFFFAGLPTFLVLRERAPRGPKRGSWEGARRGLSRLAESARAIRHFSELARFLLVFFVFSCGLMTVIAFAGIFAARTLHFSASELMLLFVLLQVSSALGAFLFGWLEDRVGTWLLIQGSLAFWTLVCVASAWCPSKSVFWVIAMVAGLGVGSLQSAARGLVGLFSPLAKSGEFFAFWGLAGKGAYALGPLVFGAISSASGSERLAILATAVFFIAGFIGMFWVDEERGRAAALAWGASPVD
ncbi:MAG TPA: MFS transporter, partial [Thermoanaerobaculia bacterium]|nr:MFS transporter [Thermoanaerobaculia bacterium]